MPLAENFQLHYESILYGGASPLTFGMAILTVINDLAQCVVVFS